MEAVSQVVVLPTVTPVPGAPPPIVGIINLRGEIIPLFDMAGLLEIGSTASGSHVVVVRTEHGPGGLLATGVPDPIELGEPLADADCHGGIGLYAVGDRFVTLIDAPALLAGMASEDARRRSTGSF